MSDIAFREVDRPARGHGGKPVSDPPFCAALLRTVETGRAIEITLNGTSVLVLRNRWTKWANRRGYRLHTVVVAGGEAFVVWLEPTQAAGAVDPVGETVTG